MTAIAIIPARGGSTRIPRKNIRPFHGKPIIAYSIETARVSCLFDEIIVSTDHQDIVAVAKGYGAKVHMRAAKLCENEVGTQEVARAALLWWAGCQLERVTQHACCIYATAPLMSAHDLRVGYAGLLSFRPPADYVRSVGGEPCADAGQFYWGAVHTFIERPELKGNQNVVDIHIPKERVCDINTEEDWQRAERMYQELKEAEREHAS